MDMRPGMKVKGGKPSMGGKWGGMPAMYTGNMMGAMPNMNAKGGYSGTDKPGWGRG